MNNDYTSFGIQEPDEDIKIYRTREKPEPPEETSVGEAEENISGQEKKSGKRAVKQSLS